MPEIKRKGIVSALYTTDDNRLNIYQDTNEPGLFHIYAAQKLGLPEEGEVEIIIRWPDKPTEEKAKDEAKTD